MESREVLFEFTPFENIMRVTAIDAETGIEIVFQAPVNTPKAALRKTAISKLKYVLNKKGEN